VEALADFLDEKRREISDRLRELQPLVDEYHRLEAAQSALEGVPAQQAARARPRSRSRGAARAAARGTGSGRRGRPRGSGTRAKEALELVRKRPGITIPEIAQAMGIKQNYLYRVLPGLQKDGLVRKEGRGWHAKEAA
jgi:sugar-specific transcriptional regulator TrmB